MSAHGQRTATSKVGSLAPVRDQPLIDDNASTSTWPAKDTTSTTDVKDDDDEYEETVFAMTLTGIFDPNAVRDNIATGAYRFAYGNTERPVVQIGDNVFAGVWDDTTVGTDIFLSTQRNDEENQNDASAKLIGTSERRLNCRKVFIGQPRGDTVNYTVLDEVHHEHDDEEMVVEEVIAATAEEPKIKAERVDAQNIAEDPQVENDAQISAAEPNSVGQPEENHGVQT